MIGPGTYSQNEFCLRSFVLSSTTRVKKVNLSSQFYDRLSTTLLFSGVKTAKKCLGYNVLQFKEKVMYLKHIESSLAVSSG